MGYRARLARALLLGRILRQLGTFAWRMALSMVRDSVRGLPCQIGSCASLGENTVAVCYVRVAYGALYVESQCSSEVVQNCFSPWRFHTCSSWFVASCPLLLKAVEIPQVQFLGEVVFMLDACRQFGVRQCRKLWNFRSCSAVMVVDVPVYAVHRRLWMSLCLRRDSGALAGGASDSVHRRSSRTLQLQSWGLFVG